MALSVARPGATYQRRSAAHTHYIDEAHHLADRVIVLAAGRITADTTPQQLRSRGGPPVIRWLLPGAPAGTLPAALAAHLGSDGRTLVIRSTDVTSPLRELTGWADEHQVDLAGLEVGPPSLEDAYLAAIWDQPAPQAGSHD